jgi:hypothetical protein
MGKIQSKDHTLIVMEKGDAEGSTFRSRELLEGEQFERGPSTDFWYRELKQARANFRECSRGQVDLLSNVYRGDQHRHQVFHIGCGHHSWTSLPELQALPPEKSCPHCHGTDHLARFGSTENLQVAVYRMSEGSAYFYASNPLEDVAQEYRFWCVRHHQSYSATFLEFQMSQGHSNGCPHCKKSVV